MPRIIHLPRSTGPVAFALAFALCTASALPALADCQSDFMALRADMDAKGKAIQAAGKNKAPPQELCPLFRSYTTAEGKAAKYLQDNKEWCQIPPDTVQAALTNNQKTAALRDKICTAAANGGSAPGAGKPPPQGSLSSALGVTTGYMPGDSSAGGGVFDTLTGNALKK